MPRCITLPARPRVPGATVSGLRHDGDMPAYRARAEFRRLTRASPWVLAGVRVGVTFRPAAPEVEPIRSRLPDSGLVGWATLDMPIVAPDAERAGDAALEVARSTWPDRVCAAVPYPSGLPDPAIRRDGD